MEKVFVLRCQLSDGSDFTDSVWESKEAISERCDELNNIEFEMKSTDVWYYIEVPVYTK